LSKNEKVKHYIRKKTYKLILSRFWVESGVKSLCGLNLGHIYVRENLWPLSWKYKSGDLI